MPAPDPCAAPCAECPWKVGSARGWLGGSTPVEFLQQSEAGIHMPCHMEVDYEAADWQEQAEAASPCRGRLSHLANRVKYMPGLPKGRVDRDAVFSDPQAFVDHHTISGPAPRIYIIGQTVLEAK